MPVHRILPVFLLFFSSIFFGCIKNAYFIADPYWESATEVSFWKIRQLGLSNGYLVHIVPTTEATPWLSLEEQTLATSVKIQLEQLLSKGYKVLLSPYWLRNLEEEMPEFSQGQLVLIDAVSSNPKIQSVVADLESGYFEMGQIAGTYMQRHSDRKQVIAMFYRGASYDRYFNSFTAGFQSKNPNSESLAPQRYYAAEVTELNLALEKLDPTQNLIILGLSHLSNLVYQRFAVEEQSLFMVENFGSDADPKQQILLSLDTDYRQLVQAAFQLTPLPDANQQDEGRIEKRPYALHLPNPEMLSDIDQVKDLAEKTIKQEQRRYNRIDRRISRFWTKLLDFLANFHLPDIQWPNWLPN